MADRYWVGGTATWDTTTTANWSTTSGGAGGASVPTAADSVFFDQASTYTVTMTGAIRCLDLTVSAGTVTFVTGTSPTLQVSGSFSIVAATVWSSTATVTFNATTARTITTNGVALACNVNFNGIGGTWQLQDAFTLSSASLLTLTAGVFDMNSYAVVAGQFSSNVSNVRTLAFGASGTLTLTSNGVTVWNVLTVTNLTVTGNKRVNISNTGASTTTITAGTPSEVQAVDFYVTSGSYAITFGSNPVVRTLDFTGYSGAWTGGTSVTAYGSFILSSSMTVGTFTSYNFLATSGSWVYNQNGRVLSGASSPNVTFGAATVSTATYDIQSALNINGSLTLQSCTLNTNNYTITIGVNFSSTSSNTRTINFGSSTVSIGGNFSVSSATGLTFNAGTSAITLGGAAPTFSTPGLTFYNVSFTNITITAVIFNGTNTFNNLSFPGRTGTAGISLVTFGGNQTVNGTLTLGAGANEVYRTFLRSSIQGTQRTITAAAITAGFDYLDFRDIVIAGAIAPIAPPSAGDCGNNGGITFPSPKTVYFASSNASTLWGSGLWAATPGGAVSLTNFPLAQDTATFDSNSRPTVNGVVTIDASWNIGSLNMSARTANMTLSGASNVNPVFYGNVTLGTGVSSISFTSGSISFSGPANRTLSSAGKTWPFATLIGGGTLTLQDSFTVSGTLTLSSGTLDINSKSTSVGALSLSGTTYAISNGTLNASTVTQTNGTLSVGSGYNISCSGAYTFTAGEITINDGVVLSTGSFSSSNSNPRIINFGTGLIYVGSNNTVVWGMGTATNFSYTGTFRVYATYSGSVGSRNIEMGVFSGSSALDIGALVASGFILGTTSTDIKNISGAYGNFDMTSVLGTLGSPGFTVYGNLNVGTTITLPSTPNAVTFAATSGVKTITTNGRTFDFPLTFNGVGGTWQLQDAVTLTSTRTTTLTAGSLDLNGFTYTTGLFSSSNSNVRSIAFGTGSITLIGSGTAWTTSTATNFSRTGTPTVNVSNNSATATTVTTGTLTEAQALDFNYTTGTYSLTDTGAVYRSVNLTGFAGTYANNARTYYGGFNAGSTATLTAGANAQTFAATSGTWPITRNGRTLDFPFTFNGVGGTWQLQDSFTVGSSRNFTLTNGTLDINGQTTSVGVFTLPATTSRAIANGVLNCASVTHTAGAFAVGGTYNISTTGTYTFTAGTLTINDGATLPVGAFSSSGSSVRSIAFGTGQISLSGNNTTIWTTATATNFSYTGTFRVVATYTGATGTRTLNQGFVSEATVQPISTTGSSGFILDTSSTDTKALSGSWGDFDMTGVTGTLSNTGRTIYGNFNVGSTVALTAGGSQTTFAATSGTKTITTNGRTLDFPLAFNGVGGTWQLQDAMNSGPSRTSALGAGTLDLNGFTYTTGLFSITGSSVRSIAFGTGNITLNGSGTVWNATTLTNFTFTGTPTVNVSNNSSTATTVATGAPTEAQALDFNYTTGTYTLTDTAAWYRNLNLTGFAGTFSNTSRILYGSFNAGSTATLSGGTSGISFAATSGVWDITPNGRTFDFPLTFNGVGGTWRLQGALTMGTSRAFILTSGTFDANNYNVTIGTMSASNTNVRRLALGSGTWTVAGTGASAWTFLNSTNATITGTATISMTGATAKTFNGGGLTWPTLNQGGAGALTIAGNNRFSNITSSYTSTGACTISFTGGSTQSVNNFTASGTPTGRLTINSTNTTPHNLVKLGGGDVNVYYCTISYSNASP